MPEMKALLTLIRPPNVFTAFADAFAGLLVCWGAGAHVPDRACAIVLASGCLYLSGIVLNDVFDRDVDARERPTRPIPSGAVPVRFAAGLGAALMLAGLLIAAWVGGGTARVALALAACILVYDGGAKKTMLGPFVMGACRGLDLALGITAGLGLDCHWPTIALVGPFVLALYIAGLTWIARDEVDGNTARRARTGLAFLALVGAGVVVALIAHPPHSLLAWWWVVTVLLLAWRNWSPVWSRHDGPSTGKAIGGGILLVPIVDAAICAVAGTPWWAFAVAALAAPVLVLKQFFSPT
jgi:4-hydroxybenzoate polyprenyltransferase